ncbi:MAG: hypothetical protein OEZ34_02765 [Spirochaetia bacterium]|nr:hypothetical protein [Spirochaetia bacterium]
MNSNNKKYKQERKCSNCGFLEQRQVSHTEASFEITRRWEDPCPQCGSNSFGMISDSPVLTEESLSIWANDEKMYFLGQDEHLMLAEEENIDLLVSFLDNQSVPASKRSILLAALCIILFDNLLEENIQDGYASEEISEYLVSILKKRLKYFSELDTIDISGYVRKVVYPVLGLKQSK